MCEHLEMIVLHELNRSILFVPIKRKKKNPTKVVLPQHVPSEPPPTKPSVQHPSSFIEARPTMVFLPFLSFSLTPPFQQPLPFLSESVVVVLQISSPSTTLVMGATNLCPFSALPFVSPHLVTLIVYMIVQIW
jgi:hypothetical protein